MKILFSLFALIMITESCGSSKTKMENKSLEHNELSGSYTISEIGENKSLLQELTITFDEKSNKVSGFAGCNSFFGIFNISENKITFSNIGRSKKLCQKEINTIENHFMEALNKINTFILKDNVLSLLENDLTLLKASKTIVTKKKNN